MNICTIVAKNYIAHARVLARSFLEAHPDGTCTVLVVDDFEGYLDPAEEPFELIGTEEIGLPDPEVMAARYDVTEFSTAVKPWLLRHLLARDGVDAVTYLDPDILVVDSIAAVEELALAHGVVLTPHFTAPLPRDQRKPSEEDILIAGTYNLGFISLAAGRTAEELLDWWSERLEEDCVIDPGGGLFVDQRWIDLVPGIWPGLHILRDTVYNIAYWNLPTRSLEIDGDGYLVDGQPLRFFHFSGFDPRRPADLSKHQNRIEVGEDPALARICGEYAELLLEAGFEEAREWPYSWNTLPNGIWMDRGARRAYREAIERDELRQSIFTPSGADRFVSYLREVPPGDGVNRYAKALWSCRPDLRAAFPSVQNGDGAGFVSWLIDGARQEGVSPRLLPLGVNAAGYLSSELGVGEAFRQVVKALEARETPFTAIDVPVEEAKLAGELGKLGQETHPFDVNLLCVNADMLPVVSRAMPPGFFQGRATAGLWFWEVEQFPERWHRSFKYLDEVWTASEFVAESLRSVSPVPVSTIRVPITPVPPAEADRAELSMPEGFCFLYVFDFRSVIRRKNPLGLVEAFRRAFEPGSGASLVIKTVGSEARPQEAAELAAAADHPDIHFVDGVVSAERKNAMIAACDCFVSLHRSEGLGLTMAEAMYFGRPVIATGYSGNLDFMNDENAFLVDYELEEIGEGAAPYPPQARWAEPRIEHAAALMRQVFEDREEAARRGARAAESIRATHSPEAAGAVLEERLGDLHRRNRMLPVHDDRSTSLTLLHHLLEFDQAPARHGTGRLRASLKRLYMRLLRPYSDHQRRIDVAEREVLDRLAFDVAALERRVGTLDGDVRGAYSAQAEELAELRELVDRLGASAKAGSRPDVS